ncbi:MAG: YfdX family protein [Halioglobus sp.]|nr:YfdX family protein [Halioglobus sp.]
MTAKKLQILPAALLGLGLMVATPLLADDTTLPREPQAQSEATESVQPDVDKQVTERAAQRRQKIAADAVAAVHETKNALRLLDEEKADEALAALERATGKMQLILAREPELALAPVDMEVVTYDLLADVKTIETAIDRAQEYLDEGEIQKARPLVANLASEMVFQTTSIPLATYPDAIKAIAPLIDAGKLDVAKAALQAALNTLVVTTDEVIPLPVLRADMLLGSAETLAENEARTEQDNETLSTLLAAARKQLMVAELLGYGTKKSFKPMYEQLDEIEKKSAGGKSGKGWFDKLKQQVSDLV